MTTIAWDGETLAVDSLVTSGGTVMNVDAQKLFLDVGRFKAVAICGSICQMRALIKWIRTGENGAPPKQDEDNSVVCVDEDGEAHIFWHDASTESQPVLGVTASGSGWVTALGALDAGATAVQAVEIACKRDCYTGGKVQSYTHGEAK